MIQLFSVLLFALTLCTARAQTTVAWLTNATGLASFPPASTRQAVAVGNESAGWSMWHWNASSTATTNATVVAYTGLATGRWVQSPVTGASSGLTAGTPTASTNVANKAYVDSVAGGGGANKLDTTNGVAVGLTTATAPTTGNSVANKTYVDSLGLNQGWVNVKNAPYNAVGNGASDDTAALQSALNSGQNVFLPSGDYKITASLTNSMYRKINGQGRSVSSISATTTNTALVFEPVMTGGDVNASFELKDLAIYAKNAVAINQVGITNWNSQDAVANIRLIHCTFSGTYQTTNDPSAGTTNVPTLAFLVSEGVGIKAAKLYDSLIQNCFIFGFGIGVYLDACDINNIDTCRLNQNARHIHLTKHDGVGSQNKIKNNDILINWRVGGIYEDQTRWNTIEDNYFESNYASSQYWINYQGEGTIFQNNRIDAPVGTIPIISINAGGPGVMLSGNRGGSDRTIEILHDFWNGASAQQTLVQFADNLSTFPETLSPQSSYTKRTSSRVWGPYSPKRLLGNASTNWPWGTTSGGLPGISTITSGNLIVKMETESTDDSLEVSITAEAAGGYVNVKWGGTSVWLADWSTSTNLQTVTRQIVRPSGVLPDSGLVFEFAASQGYICGIQLTPSPQNIQGSTLTISTNTALSGTTAMQAATAGSAATHFPVFTATPASAATTVKMRTAAEVRSDIGAGTGSVTSVGLTAPAGFTVASSPVTTSGTIAVSYASSPTGTGVFVLSTNATLFNASLTGDPAIQASGPGVSLTYFPGWETNPSSGAVQLKSRNASNFRSDIGGGASTGSVGLVLKNNPTIDTTTLTAVTAMQAAAAGSAATHFPVYTASPTAGAVAVKSRTAAEVRSDIGAGTGSGTVTSVSVTTANGVSGTVATGTTTPAISLTLGAITPTSVAATGAVSGTTLTSTVATGTAPLTVASTTLVANLNADRLDGLHKGGIQPASAALTNLNRTIGFTVDGGGSAITTGKTKGYITVPLAGTIRAWSIGVNAGTATVKVWKVATGTAVPTIANVINTSGVSISSGTYIRSTTLTDFTTTTVAANDVFAFDVTAAATASEMTFQLEITQ